MKKSWVDKQMEDPEFRAGVEREIVVDDLRDKIESQAAEIKRLRGLVRIGAQWLSEMSSRDGSGHADLSRRLLEMLIAQEAESTPTPEDGET